MAGHSRRFKDAGHDLPKFLLDCGDKKMIEHVLAMFSESDIFHCILNSDFLNDSSLKTFLYSLTPNMHVYFIEPHELGPTHTVAIADLKVDETAEIIISYCDFTVSWDYELFKRQVLGYDAGAPYFTGFQAASLGKTKYAYMRHENFNMIELREKESFTSDRLSEAASTGIYYFKSLSYFQSLTNSLFSSGKKFPNNESYTSLLLNESVEMSGNILLFKVDQFICFGTPEDYDQFNYWHKYFIVNNKREHNSIFADISMIPMAGDGARFQQYGYRTSKPSIQIGSNSLVSRCISSLPRAKKGIYLLKESDSKKRMLIHDIKTSDQSGSIEIIPVKNKTSGQASTCLLGAKNADPDASLMISSCDYEIIYNQSRLMSLKSNDPDVLIFTFRLKSLPVGSYENFAYVKHEDNKVIEVIEKKCISNKPWLDQMVTGTFWYKKSKYFVDSAQEMIRQDIKVNNEHYVGTSINLLINSGMNVMFFEVDKWVSFGDPLELELYYFWDSYFSSSVD